MILADHPNVLKLHCLFVIDHNLWVIMPFMAGGSCLHILKAVHPDGFEEVVIATILREVLKGLEYVHHQGRIHRDVKAGNILIDANDAIKFGDFGVSGCLFDSAVRTRKTFVGKPCCDKSQNQLPKFSSRNGAPIPQVADVVPPEILPRDSRPLATNDEQDEKAKVAAVHQRGRFEVTSENIELDKVALSLLLQKSHSMQVITQHPSFSHPPPSPSDPTPPKLVGHTLFLMVQSVLHTNMHQREIILSLVKQVSVGDFTVDGGGLPMNTSVAEKSLLEAAHDREKELLREITDLQLRLICAQEELQKYKTENACDYSPTGLRKIKSKIINPVH